MKKYFIGVEVILEPQPSPETGYVVKVSNYPEIITQGESGDDCIINALDALAEAVCNRAVNNKSLDFHVKQFQQD